MIHQTYSTKDNNSNSRTTYFEQSYRSTTIDTARHGSNGKFVAWHGVVDAFSSDSESDSGNEKSDRSDRKDKKTLGLIRTVFNQLKRPFAWVCACVYTTLMWAFYFEKWLLHVEKKSKFRNYILPFLLFFGILFLLFLYGSFVLETFHTFSDYFIAGIGNIFNVLFQIVAGGISVVVSVFDGIQAPSRMPVETLQSWDPKEAVESDSSSNVRETSLIFEELSAQVRALKTESSDSLRDVKLTQETISALKIQISLIEEKLNRHEKRLDTHNADFKKVDDHEQQLKAHDASFQKLENEIIENVFDKVKDAIIPILSKHIETTVVTSCETRNCPPGSPDLVLSTADIEEMIKRAISKYDADKTGLPDLALESAGGSIISTRCTKSSDLRNSVISYWGFRLWSPQNSPRTIIQPGVVPGECWAFEGSVGDVVIKLAIPAVVTGFTLEHIPKNISRTGSIDSAPKQFQVLGVVSEHDTEDIHDYGIYEYEDNGEPLQYFPVKIATLMPYPMVELKILSNHGNMRHTCIYRFRVHGAIELGRSHEELNTKEPKDSDDDDINLK